MRRVWSLALLLVPMAVSTAEKPCRGPLWTVDLAAKFGFRPFGLAQHPRNQPPMEWKTQQGVVFITPDTLAIYQVKESEEGHQLKPRDASGGGGRYFLEIVFLDRLEGKEIRRLRLTTESSGQSAVYPTQNGRFLVVTGKMLRIYSSTFDEIASRPGPIGQSGEKQYWHVSVIPSGKRIYAYLNTHIDMPFLLDADTLDTIPDPKPGDVALWSGGAKLFPDLKGPNWGVFTAAGNWLTLPLDVKGNGRVFWVFQNVPSQGSGGSQSKEIRALSPSGQAIWDIRTHDDIYSFVSNGSLIAVATYHSRADPLDLGLGANPRRIAIYDLERKSERCAVPISYVVSGGWNSRFFDLSFAGNVAIAQQNLLSLYEP